MKKPLLLFCIILLALRTQAQDVILKTSGEEIFAKVLEITLTEIHFQLPDTTDKVIRTLPKAEVFMVKFENGQKEMMQTDSAAYAASPASPQEMYELGKREAKLYYKGNGAMWGSAAATLAFLPSAIIIAAIPPQVKPSQVSDLNYLNNQDYLRGYKKQAHKRKVGKAAMGVGIAVVTSITVTAVMLSAYGLN